jgi:rsbT co-antagonist protein RsbR
MTTSPSQPTNGLPEHTPLAAFRAFLESERPALTSALVRDLTEHAPHYRTMSDTQRAERVSENIDDYLAGLDDSTRLIQATERRLGPLLTQGLDLDAALRFTSIYRRHFVDAALRAYQAGVEGAADGLRGLMELIDVRSRTLARIYQERLKIFETLVNNSPDGIGVSGLDGKQLHPNPAFGKMLGYGDELLGMHFSEYVEDNDPMIMQQLMEQGFWQGISAYRRKDGSTLRCHSTIFLIPGPDGQPVAMGGVIRDISEQLRAEEELKRQADDLRIANNRLEQSFTASPLATIEWDIQGIVRSWNPAAARIFGWRADEAVGKNIIQLLVPDLALEQVQLVMDAILGGQAENSRNLNVTKDGRTIVCQWYNTVLRDTAGDVVGGLSQTEDITNQTRREAELRTFFALAENSPDGVIVTDNTAVVSYANPAIRSLLGFGETMAGVQIVEHLVASQEELAELGQQMARTGSWNGILGYRRRDGSVVQCLASSFLIKESDGPAVVATVVRDLTAQQHAEQERVRLQEQVIAAQQAALRELSTPLIPIAEGVVAMPLIGSIDSGRAQMVVEELLRGVATNRAATAIVDITGVPVVDTQVAGALVRAAQAVELLGARVLLTGIRPEVAQTLVGIGVNLGSIITRSTLQDGITFALGQRTR